MFRLPRRRPARMGIAHAARLDRLEEMQMRTSTDWRDLQWGIMPSARDSALLGWLEAEHPDWLDELRQTPDLDEHFDALRRIWTRAGQPDPAGAMHERNRAWRVHSYHMWHEDTHLIQ